MEIGPPTEPAQPRRTWPWFVLAAVVLAAALAVLWMSVEVRRRLELFVAW